MAKKLTRTLAGVMSLMFVGQIMVFGDGASQGILHADTIASAAEAIEGMKNADQLAEEFEEATKGLGEVDYFELPESVEQNIMTYPSLTIRTANITSTHSDAYHIFFLCLALSEKIFMFIPQHRTHIINISYCSITCHIP